MHLVCLLSVSQARKAEVEAAADRITSMIPLPSVLDTLHTRLLDDMRGAAAVGPDALPSAAFFTLINTHQSLNCAAFSPDTTTVAGVSVCLTHQLKSVLRAAEQIFPVSGSVTLFALLPMQGLKSFEA